MTMFDPAHLTDFAETLLLVDETAPTGQFLAGLSGKLLNQWKTEARCKASDIPLPLPRNKALFPSECEMEAAYFSFIYQPGPEAHFPTLFDYQVRVSASLSSQTALFELEDHWRVDTHVDEGGAPPNEPHPQFHFQRGGHAQDRFAADSEFLPGTTGSIAGAFRGLFQCPGPRMPALPMDPILALDFSIGQADGKVWRRLRNVPEYYEMVERSQRRVWSPFFAALTAREFQRAWLGEIAI